MFRKSKKHQSRGFTLIEMLVALTIIAVISTSLYGTFAGGARLWIRMNREDPDLQVDLFFEKLTRELHAAYLYQGEKVEGGGDSFQFVTAEPVPSRLKIGYDPKKETIEKSITHYRGMLYDDKDATRIRTALEKVTGLRIFYYAGSDNPGEMIWKRQWLKNCLPRAVKIHLEYGAKKRQYTHIIEIPTGHCKDA